ncbi:MAG: histidinol dehydrogenase [Verrucomicrobiota bacterium]
MQILEYSDSSAFNSALQKFCANATVSGDVSSVVREVLGEVAKVGDRAVLKYTEKFDGAQLAAKSMRVELDELRAAEKTLSTLDRKVIREAIKQVKEFHKKTLPRDWKAKNAQGGTIGECFYPINRVGLYIPGGNVPLVSTVIMTAVLAKLAKCPEIAVCTPPAADGSIASGMLAALSMAGVKEVYKVGGVQAVGAMAFGTTTIPAVDKIYGPGNAFVMEAKRQVLGVVGIDLLPGPSEIMVIADAGASPQHVAADLLAQAEHGSGKEIIYLATTSKALVQKVEKAVAKQLPMLSHADKCAKIIKDRCLVIKCRTLDQAAVLANYIAPEHLELQVADKSIQPLTKKITTAGAILQGYLTPTVLGDFTAGPSHTLPTGRAGRFFSGLQVTDFMRRSSIVRYDARSLSKAAPVVETFARLEQLDAHGRSLTIRL